MGEQHSGFDLLDAADIDLDEALASDHTWTGITCNGTAAVDLAVAEVVYLNSSGKWDKVDADAAATTDGLLAIVTEAISADGTGRLLLIGFFRDDSWTGLTVGGYMYVHTTAGDLTQTAPTGSGDQVRKVGVAVADATIWFNPDSTVVEIS